MLSEVWLSRHSWHADSVLHAWYADSVLHTWYADSVLHTWYADSVLHTWYADSVLHTWYADSVLHRLGGTVASSSSTKAALSPRCTMSRYATLCLSARLSVPFSSSSLPN
jgi:hypothetical protein